MRLLRPSNRQQVQVQTLGSKDATSRDVVLEAGALSKPYNSGAMTAAGRYATKKVLTIFQQSWAERDAFRKKQGIEDSGRTANWEVLLEACKTRAQELFQTALAGLEGGRPPTLMFEELVARLEAAEQAPTKSSS
jgi:hypothetical protein